MPFTNKTISLTPGSAGAAVRARAMFQCHLVTPNLSRDSTATPKYDWAIAGTAHQLQNLTELQQGKHATSKIWLGSTSPEASRQLQNLSGLQQGQHSNSKIWPSSSPHTAASLPVRDTRHCGLPRRHTDRQTDGLCSLYTSQHTHLNSWEHFTHTSVTACSYSPSQCILKPILCTAYFGQFLSLILGKYSIN